MQEKPGSPASVPATLGLNHTEERIIARLISQGCLSREQICALTTRAHQSIKLGSVGAIVHGLRKKLILYGIRLDVVRGFGFELRQKDRAKVLQLLARPKPTRSVGTSPTGAAEAAGAKNLSAGSMEPEERPDAA
jgi:hypothetical protein